MLKRFIATAVALAASSAAMATVTVRVDLCDGGDGIALPANNLQPGGVAMVDVFADVAGAPGQAFTAAGVRVETAAGVTLRYAVDPNTGNPVPVNVGTANKFNTFFSIPRARDANNRYTNGAAAAAGRYSPTGPSPTYSPTEANVAYFASPPPTAGTAPAAGYIFRVAINLPADMPTGETFVLLFNRDYPAGNIPLCRSVGGQTGDLGSVAATFDAPNVTGIDWNLSVTPEPTSLALLALGGLMAFRRR